MVGTTNLQELKQGAEFTWGEVLTLYEVGEYDIVEYYPWEVEGNIVLSGKADYNKLRYHYYVGGRDTSHSTDTLDAALAGAIAYKHEGASSPAGVYFIRMLKEGK